jgi:hypothetical protein
MRAEPRPFKINGIDEIRGRFLIGCAERHSFLLHLHKKDLSQRRQNYRMCFDGYRVAGMLNRMRQCFLSLLGAMGEAGVRLCLEIIAKELSVTMGLCGAVDINAANSSVLIAPPLIPK